MKNFSVLVVFTIGVVSGLARSSPSPQSVNFQIGDDAFRQRHVKEFAYKALSEYRNLHTTYPNDVEAGWRLAMACQFVGMRFIESSEEKKEIFAEGRDAGLASIDLKEDCGQCHFWTAVNMALYGQTVGPLKTLFTLKPTRSHLLRSVEIDPAYAYGGAYRILGIISWKLPGILGGSDSEAKEYLQKAISIAPSEPMNYWFLSQLLLEAFHDPAAALNMAKSGTEMPEPDWERVEARESWHDLNEFVKAHEPKSESVAALVPSVP